MTAQEPALARFSENVMKRTVGTKIPSFKSTSVWCTLVFNVVWLYVAIYICDFVICLYLAIVWFYVSMCCMYFIGNDEWSIYWYTIYDSYNTHFRINVIYDRCSVNTMGMVEMDFIERPIHACRLKSVIKQTRNKTKDKIERLGSKTTIKTNIKSYQLRRASSMRGLQMATTPPGVRLSAASVMDNINLLPTPNFSYQVN